jgi:hypothetical protein
MSPDHEQQQEVRRWQDLQSQEQTRLLIDYGNYQDEMSIPTTCDIETKNRRFSNWLAARAIQYP